MRAVFIYLFVISFPIVCFSQLISGPLVGHTTDSTAKIWSYAGEGKVVEIRYGEKNTPVNQWKSLLVPPDSQLHFISRTDLTDLSPLTSYGYEILVDGTPSDTGTFTTSPPYNKSSKFTFMVASCMRGFGSFPPTNPDFNLLLGDNVYSNSTNPDTIWKYNLKIRSSTSYGNVLKNIPTYAIWDDHDYADDDSDGEAVGKENSWGAFKELWANPNYGTAADTGIYYTFKWGEAQIFMLDGRYHRSPNSDPDGENKSMLGLKQREWLLNELKSSNSIFKFISAGSNFLDKRDSWESFPTELNTIQKFIKDNYISGVIWMSGDTHSMALREHDTTLVGYPTHEIVSSAGGYVYITVNTMVPDPTLDIKIYVGGDTTESKTVTLSEVTRPGSPLITVQEGLSNNIVFKPFGGRQISIKSKFRVKKVQVLKLDGKIIAHLSINNAEVFWNGKDGLGKKATSGLYLLHILNNKSEQLNRIFFLN